MNTIIKRAVDVHLTYVLIDPPISLSKVIFLEYASQIETLS